MQEKLRIEKLSLKFKNKDIFDNLDYTFASGKITAIIGPSGCGKTSLLKTLNNMIDKATDAKVRGHVYLDGQNIKTYPQEVIFQKIGMVFQTPHPFPFSVQKNMEYALKYYKISKEERKMIIEEKLEITGLYQEVKNHMNESALKLSGGQQQRLCIARALTVEPEVLLLDEPCSALDVKNTAKIEEMILDLVPRYTVILVTHNLAQAKRVADEVVFLLDGEIIEAGTVEDMFSDPQHDKTKEYIEGVFG